MRKGCIHKIIALALRSDARYIVWRHFSHGRFKISPAMGLGAICITAAMLGLRHNNGAPPLHTVTAPTLTELLPVGTNGAILYRNATGGWSWLSPGTECIENAISTTKICYASINKEE